MRREFAAAWLAIFGAAAFADGVGMLPGESVTSELTETGETRAAAVQVVAGADLSIRCRALGKSRVAPTLELHDPSGARRDLDGDGAPDGRSSSLSLDPVDATGIWTVTLSAPANQGGAFRLSVRSRSPRSVELAGTAIGGEGTVAFDAVSGTSSVVTVVSDGPDAFTPSVTVVGPDGDTLAIAAGRGGSARTPAFTVPRIGTCTVRVGGGDGPFRVAVRMRPPRPRQLDWKAAERVPDWASASPLVVANDSVADLTLVGVGFRETHAFQVVKDGEVLLSRSLDAADASQALLRLPVVGVPPGAYQMRILTPAGNVVTHPDTLTLTNRPPELLEVEQPELPWAPSLPISITGTGFDPGVAVSVTRSLDGATVPLTSVERVSAGRIDVVASPLPFQVGPWSIRAVDEDGVAAPAPVEIDVLGARGAAVVVGRYEGSDAASRASGPRDAAWDVRRRRVCVAMRSGGRHVSWALVDPESATVLGSITVSGTEQGPASSPAASYNPKDDTFALAWRGRSRNWPPDPFPVRMRIVRAGDFTAVAELTLDPATDGAVVDVAANTEDGGWLAVWDQWNAHPGTNPFTYALRVSAEGTPSADGPVTVLGGADAHLSAPAVVESAPGRFVVVGVGGCEFGGCALLRTVLAGDGSALHASLPVLPAIDDVPVLAVEPLSGSVLVVGTGRVSDATRVITVRLTGADSAPGPAASLDTDGGTVIGAADSAVWSPERLEWVIGVSLDDGRAVVRRARADGVVKRAPVPQVYEGARAVVWSGAAAGELGMLLMQDFDEDGEYRPADGSPIRAFPMR